MSRPTFHYPHPRGFADKRVAKPLANLRRGSNEKKNAAQPQSLPFVAPNDQSGRHLSFIHPSSTN